MLVKACNLNQNLSVQSRTIEPVKRMIVGWIKRSESTMLKILWLIRRKNRRLNPPYSKEKGRSGEFL